MIERKSGKIINVTSIGAGKGMAHVPVYNAAKAAIVSFTKSIGVAVAAQGINVNSVAPGMGFTNFGGGKLPRILINWLSEYPQSAQLHPRIWVI